MVARSLCRVLICAGVLGHGTSVLSSISPVPGTPSGLVVLWPFQQKSLKPERHLLAGSRGHRSRNK
jgi:hypothetical protein